MGESWAGGLSSCLSQVPAMECSWLYMGNLINLREKNCAHVPAFPGTCQLQTTFGHFVPIEDVLGAMLCLVLGCPGQEGCSLTLDEHILQEDAC